MLELVQVSGKLRNSGWAGPNCNQGAIKLKGDTAVYGPQVLPAFLPSTGSHIANVIIAGISITLGAAIVVTTIVRIVAKKAYKA